MDDDSEHKADDSDDGLVLDSEWIGEEESEDVSEGDGNTAILTVRMWAFFSGFSCPIWTLLLLAPILLELGEATHSENLVRIGLKDEWKYASDSSVASTTFISFSAPGNSWASFWHRLNPLSYLTNQLLISGLQTFYEFHTEPHCILSSSMVRVSEPTRNKKKREQ